MAGQGSGAANRKKPEEHAGENNELP
jgi:hypothetical protein